MENQAIAQKDFGQVSEILDEIKGQIQGKKLETENEAQTRFDVIDRVIKEVLQWQHGQIRVEPRQTGLGGYIDYILSCGDFKIIIEAKKIGATFPSPSRQKRYKLTGSVLGNGEIGDAIKQAEAYAISEKATTVVVTNGLCWCLYSVEDGFIREQTYALVFYPFQYVKDAEDLFNHLSEGCVENNSLYDIGTSTEFLEMHKMLDVVRDADDRLNRNSLADLITPALDEALHGESIIDDAEKLEYCFVATEARTKFDHTLGVYLNDNKPKSVTPAKRIKKNKNPSDLSSHINFTKSKFAPPVILVIGSVGSGKSTYLKHFELVEGASLLQNNDCQWMYIDFEKMGKSGNPRRFIYETVRNYLNIINQVEATNYDNLIEPIYKSELNVLLNGPMAGIRNNSTKIQERLHEMITKDYDDCEPYVEKLLARLANIGTCVLVLDNVDLYEDEQLEVSVFSEGIALSKKVKCHVIVSIRDTTFVKHRNSSSFDLVEPRKLWLDPPPFSEVLSKRLTYAKTVLKGKSASIYTANNFKLKIPDLSVFFDLVQTSLLSGRNGKLIQSLADKNIRRGVSLVTNFLTSGHIQADKAIRIYLEDGTRFRFPFHEVFRGAILGQWKYYKEQRAELVNLYESGIASAKLQIIRIYILRFLFLRAKEQGSNVTSFDVILDVFSHFSLSSYQLIKQLNSLQKNGLIRTTTVESINPNCDIFITESGAYCSSVLISTFEYLETVMMDTAIFNADIRRDMEVLTKLIDSEKYEWKKFEMRKERMTHFLTYLTDAENSLFDGCEASLMVLKYIDIVSKSVKHTMDDISTKLK